MTVYCKMYIHIARVIDLFSWNAGVGISATNPLPGLYVVSLDGANIRRQSSPRVVVSLYWANIRRVYQRFKIRQSLEPDKLGVYKTGF